MKNTEPEIDYNADPFKELREEGEYSGGISNIAAAHEQEVNVEVDFVKDVGSSGGDLMDVDDAEAIEKAVMKKMSMRIKLLNSNG